MPYDLIESLVEKINKAIEDFLKTAYKLPVDYKELNKFYDETIKYIMRKGKRIRPLYFILGYHLYSNKPIDDSEIINYSIFLEILHSFFLCHDDIIDNSDLRRGEESLHISLNRLVDNPSNANENNEIGKQFALISGDILFALSCKAINSINIPNNSFRKTLIDKFLDYVLDTTIGQTIDMISGFKNINDVDDRIIEATHILKTSKYSFECPLVLGAMCSGAVNEEINKLKVFAMYIGIAFQIQDDLIGLFGNIEDIGKPIISDVLEGKKTLLILDTLNSLNEQEKDSFANLFYERPLTDESFNKIKHIVSSTGAKDKSINRIDLMIKNAFNIIDTLNTFSST